MKHMTMGEKIKYLRKQRDLTQDQLGRMTGIHPVTIRKYELNKIQPTPAQIERLALALGVGSIALSGVDNSGLRIETYGDLKGLIMTLYNIGVISFSGERNADNSLIKETVKINFHSCLSSYLKLFCVTDNHEALEPSNVFFKMQNEFILDELLKWEKHKYLYNSFLQNCDPEDEQAQKELRQYERTISKIELEMQKQQILLNR